MANMMKAAVVRELGKPLAIEEVPVPEPKENQILVRIAATGICHTDLHAAKGDWPVKPNPPFIPGHEGVGTVAAVGATCACQGRGPSRDSVASHGLRLLLLLPDRWETLCDSQSEQWLFGKRQLRRICARGPELRRPPPDRSNGVPRRRSSAPA